MIIERHNYNGVAALLTGTTILLVLFCSFPHTSLCYNYAVQPHAVEFTVVPKSHITIEGETIELKCNFTIIKLGSNYPEPYAEWRHNATTVLQKIRPTKEDIAQGYLFSKLVLGPLTTGHTGFYECLAVDGMVRLDYLAERQVGQYVMSSPRAHLQVLTYTTRSSTDGSGDDGSSLEPYGMGTVFLQLGEPFSIPCYPDSVVIPSHIDWYQNGTEADRIMILSNGSLLLSAASIEDSGTYQCIIHIGDSLVDGPITNIQVLPDLYREDPHVMIDPPSPVVILSTDEQTHFTCFVLGPMNGTLRLEKLINDRVFTASSDTSYLQLYVNEIGDYGCRLMRDQELISIATTTVVLGLVSSLEDDVLIFAYDNITLECGITEDYQSLYWYRNGTLIPTDASTYYVRESWDYFEGVYQCFVVASDGVVYQNSWRVFDYRYTNPPTAVTCNVKFSKDAYAYLWPVVKFRWKKPDFVAFEGSLNPGSYIIYAENGISEMGYAQDTLQYDFELAGIGDRETFEGRYEMFVRTNRADSAQGRHLGPPSRCEVNTFDRVLYPPLPLKPVCTSDRAKFIWTNPLSIDSFEVEIAYITIEAVCLYGNHPLYRPSGIDYDAQHDYDYYDAYEANLSEYKLVLNVSDPSIAKAAQRDERKIPLGAVCTARGTYLIDTGQQNTPTVDMPPVNCIAMSDASDLIGGDEAVQLGISCDQEMIDVTWNTSLSSFYHTENITLTLVCLDIKLNTVEVFSLFNAEYAGSHQSNTSEYSLCSFYGQFIDTSSGPDGLNISISPVQCYTTQTEQKFYQPVFVPNDTVYTRPPPMPPMTSLVLVPTMTTPTSVLITNSVKSTTMTYHAIVLRVSIPSSIVIAIIIVLLLLVLIILKCRRSNTYNARRLHFAVPWDLDKEYNPVNPNVISGGVSMKTLYDNEQDWSLHEASSSPEINHQKLDLRSSEATSTEGETSQGLKDGETPVIISSPVIKESIADDSGCELQYEIHTRDNDHGKEHLFNRLLTGIKNEKSSISTGQEEINFQVETGFYDDKNIQHDNALVTLEGIARMVADTLHTNFDATNVPSAPPSSGYGTIDGSKFTSTEVGDVSPEYLARKLQDVEEMELIQNDFTEHVPNTNKSDLKLHNVNVNQDHTTTDQNQLPSLLLTPPEHHPDTTVLCTTIETQNSLGTINPHTSGSTGNISCGGSYYQDKEGYLHMSSVRNTDLTLSRSHQSSLDNLSKSL